MKNLPVKKSRRKTALKNAYLGRNNLQLIIGGPKGTTLMVRPANAGPININVFNTLMAGIAARGCK